MQSESNAPKGLVTFVVFTYNEERRIEWAIKNFQHWGPILVVDNYSEDRTVEIARSYGCDVLMNKNKGWVEDNETVNKVRAAVQTDWIYWGFADEFVDVATFNAILGAVNSGKYSLVNVARKNFYYGKFCYDAYADRMNRIFKKDAIDFTTNTIHHFGTVVVPKEQICTLNAKYYYVRHFISNNAKTYVRAMDGYTDIEASRAKRNYGLITVLGRAVKTFVMNYFIHGGYKAGREGLFIILQDVYYGWLLTMKAYETEMGLSVPEIEALNNRERSALLEKLS